MFKTINFLMMILALKCNVSEAIIGKTENVLSAHQMGQTIALCFSQNLIRNCLEKKIFEAIDKAIANNETWQFSDYLVVEKIASPNTFQNVSSGQERSLSDKLADKLLQLAQTRAIKLQLSPMFMRTLQKRSLSPALDDFTNIRDDNDVDGGGEEQLSQEEGRKKKDKDKNMAMIGGMAMIAMVAQMFLGKVILIAGAAFVMAKIALLISVLGSLKKGSSGSSGGGGGTEHVIVTSAGGGGGHSHEYSSGWHR
ncbi:hypothetical protein DOY81_003395, partial [Sarcophaga bullata]